MEANLAVLRPPESLTPWHKVLLGTSEGSKKLLETARGFALEKALLKTVLERNCLTNHRFLMPIFRWRMWVERDEPRGLFSLGAPAKTLVEMIVCDNSPSFQTRMGHVAQALEVLRTAVVLFKDTEASQALPTEKTLGDLRRDLAAAYRLLHEAREADFLTSDESAWPWLVTDGAIESLQSLTKALYLWAQVLIKTVVAGVPQRSTEHFDVWVIMWYTVYHSLLRASVASMPEHYRKLVAAMEEQVLRARVVPAYATLLAKASIQRTKLGMDDMAAICRIACYLTDAYATAAKALTSEDKYTINLLCSTENVSTHPTKEEVGDPLAPLAAAYRAAVNRGHLPEPKWTEHGVPGWMRSRDLSKLTFVGLSKPPAKAARTART